MRNDAARLPAIDALKAIACVLIVLHHLAFYGPMADVAKPLMPGVIGFLDEYARQEIFRHGGPPSADPLSKAQGQPIVIQAQDIVAR